MPSHPSQHMCTYLHTPWALKFMRVPTRMVTYTRMGGLVRTARSVLVSLIGFFQIRLKPHTCSNTCSGFPQSTDTWLFRNTTFYFLEFCSKGSPSFCCHTLKNSLSCALWHRQWNLSLWLMDSDDTFSQFVPAREPDWPWGGGFADLVYRFRTQKQHWYGSWTVSGSRSPSPIRSSGQMALVNAKAQSVNVILLSSMHKDNLGSHCWS